MHRNDLNERLVDYAVMVIKITDMLPSTRAGNHLAGQMVRSGTSPALNYGEAISGESRKDFIHKMQIVLKELRETLNNLKIVRKAEMIKDKTLIDRLYKENDELVSIFVKSIVTAKKNEKMAN